MAVLLCAGCTGDDVETVEIMTTDNQGQPTVVTQEVTQAPAAPTPSDAVPTTAAMTSATLEHPDGAAVSFQLPQTWTIVPMEEPERTDQPIADAVAPLQWCLVPPDAPPVLDGCSGVLFAMGPDWLPGPAGSAYSPRQVDGWRSGAGPLPCPFGEDGARADASSVTIIPDQAGATAEATPDDSEVDLLVTAAEGLPLTSVSTEVDGRRVTYETWRASCSLTEDVVITPQVWHDLELGVLVRDYFGLPETALVVESLRGA